MDNSRRAREKAEALMPGPQHPHRSEKGTAGGIIAAENAATRAKTERLRALRLEREAAVVSEMAAGTAKIAAKKSAGASTRKVAAKPR